MQEKGDHCFASKNVSQRPTKTAFLAFGIVEHVNWELGRELFKSPETLKAGRYLSTSPWLHQRTEKETTVYLPTFA